MTPLPKRKLSTRRQGRRRKDHIASFQKTQTCANCGKPTLSHKACPNCGFYAGKLAKAKKVRKTV